MGITHVIAIAATRRRRRVSGDADRSLRCDHDHEALYDNSLVHQRRSPSKLYSRLHEDVRMSLPSVRRMWNYHETIRPWSLTSTKTSVPDIE